MSEETLFSSIRRLMRELRICEQHGGLMSVEMLHAANTVDIMMAQHRKLEINEKELAARKAAALLKEQGIEV